MYPCANGKSEGVGGSGYFLEMHITSYTVSLVIYSYLLFSYCFTFYPLMEGTSSTLQDLISFWTGKNNYQSKDGQLLVKFDTGENKLPLSETCFKSLILPITHTEYLNLNIALNYGAKGFAFH